MWLFGDDKKGKVLGTSVVKVNDHFTLNDVALVDMLRYNLLSVSQLVDVDLHVLFWKSDSWVLDSVGNLVCGVSRIRNVFQADFSLAQSFLRCLLSQSSSKLWKWYRRLGHMSFDLLCWLSGLGLLRGLPMLKFESDHVCAPCRHSKMIAASYSPVLTPWWLSSLDSYSIWTLLVPLRFTPWVASGMFLSLLMTTLSTLGFSFWKARMRCLSTFGA
jgi:hypothetical protein